MSTTPENRQRALRLLLVEDSAADAQLLLDLLEDAASARAEVTWVPTLAAARLALARPVDCVLLDVGLPDARGLEGLIALRGQAPDTPIVVVTGLGDREFALQAVAAGAQDYLTKGSADIEALLRAAHYAIERQRAQGLLTL
jgi:DNA-binding response OmpR family regulator